MSHKKHFFAEIEETMLKTWQEEDTFKKSLENRIDAPLFSFYDGPPFANGVPHYGHLVQTTIKDSITRYKTMQGFHVPRRVGWDTHGLPVEYAIEKEHGFRGKQDIVAYGIDKFNQECRDSVFTYKDVWEKMFTRVGRWADYSQTYATLDVSYIESVWWVFKTIYDKGLIYKDFRSTPYCPRCATALSNFELNQGYQDNVPDPSLFVLFKLQDEPAYLLGWTTTPWSLPGNAAIAVKPDAKYVYVEVPQDDNKPTKTIIVARERLSALSCDTYHIVKEVNGSELVGKSYEPVFKLNNLESYEHSKNLYKVWAADFVSIEDGSGVLHVAPAFGEDDLELGKSNNIPVLLTIDEYGKVLTGIGIASDIEGQFFKKADEKIIAHLSSNDAVFAAETFLHTYPFCWRCDTPLLYYATDNWLVNVTKIRDRLVTNNQKINWTPNHIKDGRFGNWLEGARDWAISRSRFWGAPLPVWVTDDGDIVVVGSVGELKELAINPENVVDLHRPYIDDIVIKTKTGKLAKRIPEVFDCWFESGAMPYAQEHYPFENADNWDQKYPATFIAEAIDQTRGWFYTLHVLASALFDSPAFENVICSGWVVAADGEKLSKRKKNYAPMDEVFDQFGVDTLRYFMASSPIVNGEDVRFSVDFLRDTQRKIFMTLNNIYSFYSLYAEVDKWVPRNPGKAPISSNLLDKWMISRLHQTVSEMTKAMDEYRLDKATRPLADLLDDMSNWFVRRSRRRFWKSEDDSDKESAYETLYYCLTTTITLLSPISPFLTDHLWRKLTRGVKGQPTSVHLCDWPKAGEVDNEIISQMQTARDAITVGLSLRAEAKIKVRQPLHTAKVPMLPEEYKDIIAEELNVKTVEWADQVSLDTTVTKELKYEGLMRDSIRHIQNERKTTGLNVDDRIILELSASTSELETALQTHQETIAKETLAAELIVSKGLDSGKTVKIEEHQLTIKLMKQ